MPSLWTRQDADAYNQSLSFDTSRVTDMERMFQVRPAPAHATTPIGLPLQRRRLHPLLPRPACRPLSLPPFGLGRARKRTTCR